MVHRQLTWTSTWPCMTCLNWTICCSQWLCAPHLLDQISTCSVAVRIGGIRAKKNVISRVYMYMYIYTSVMQSFLNSRVRFQYHVMKSLKVYLTLFGIQICGFASKIFRPFEWSGESVEAAMRCSCSGGRKGATLEGVWNLKFKTQNGKQISVEYPPHINSEVIKVPGLALAGVTLDSES